MKSISWKILKVALGGLVIAVLLLIGSSVYFVSSISNTDSDALVSQVCSKETLRFDDEFLLLENSVQTISSYEDSLEDEYDEQGLLSDEFCDKVREMTIAIANRTDGAMAVYFRYNPSLYGDGLGGFFWSRSSNDETFAYEPPTDIAGYSEDDTEHVGWFYQPMKNGSAMWMSPYYNANLDVFMISYIVPCFTDSGKFLGVIGMDIDFAEIMKMTDGVSQYKTGLVEVVDPSTGTVYTYDSEDSTVSSKEMVNSIYNQISLIANTDEVITMNNDQNASCLASANSLRNGMIMMFSITRSEINASRNQMLLSFAIITLLVVAIIAIYSIRTTNKIVKPIKELTDITGKYAKGDWDDAYISTTGDEIQDLSESISVMAETTRSYIEKINANANTDALTGLKNKNCYLSYIERYKDPASIKKEYAIVVFDINFLKKTNDIYGHEVGDVLIKRAGMYICKIFDHSPVFRIGGDEYNVIMENDDYKNRAQLCKDFEEKMKDLPPVAEGIPLSISYGMAVFGEDGNDYDTVFKCADERMYEYKKAMKAARE